MRGIIWQYGVGRRIRDAAAAADSSKLQIRELEARLEYLTLISQALWELLKKETKLKDKELVEKIVEIDLKDGQVDGKITKPVIKCKKCNSPISVRLGKCLSCGEPYSEKDLSPYFSV